MKKQETIKQDILNSLNQDIAHEKETIEKNSIHLNKRQTDLNLAQNVITEKKMTLEKIRQELKNNEEAKWEKERAIAELLKLSEDKIARVANQKISTIEELNTMLALEQNQAISDIMTEAFTKVKTLHVEELNKKINLLESEITILIQQKIDLGICMEKPMQELEELQIACEKEKNLFDKLEKDYSERNKLAEKNIEQGSQEIAKIQLQESVKQINSAIEWDANTEIGPKELDLLSKYSYGAMYGPNKEAYPTILGDTPEGN